LAESQAQQNQKPALLFLREWPFFPHFSGGQRAGFAGWRADYTAAVMAASGAFRIRYAPSIQWNPPYEMPVLRPR
jgi:hypothetical protein